MRYFAAFPLIAASLIGSASLPQCANAQSSKYALNRLFLDPNDSTPIYDIVSFSNETAVANYYGATSLEAKLATEFFAGYTGPPGAAHMLFTRYPDEPGRAHLYGADISNLTLPQLQSINGPISITSGGYVFSGDVNLSDVTGFNEAAQRISSALNKNLPVAATTTKSSIAPVTVSFLGSTNANILTVSAISSGSIQVGSLIDGKDVPPGAQVCAQLSGTPGGVGVYSLFLQRLSKIDIPVPTETMTETYGVLTVGSVSSGTVAVGQQVTDATGGVVPRTAIEDHLSGSGARSTWVVNYAQTVTDEPMQLTGAPLYVRYTSIQGDNNNTRGFFFLQQSQNFNFSTSSLSYMSGGKGHAALELGMSKADSGTTSEYGKAYLSTPGLVVIPESESYCLPPTCTTAAAFMSNLAATMKNKGEGFSTFQNMFFLPSLIPPGTPPALKAWANSTGGLYTYLEGYSNFTTPIEDQVR